MTLLMIVELLVVLVALWVGARYGSLALGAISGIGLAILVFCFHLKPGTPPTDVIYIIIAAVTCAGMLQASGGMDWMIQIAERLLRKHPERITILAPFTTFFLTVLVGTGHVVYTLMPIICDIALKKGIRPERPCGIASIASQIGITCSPIAAAVVAFSTISIEQGFHVSNVQVILVTIPACIIGILFAVIASWHRGLDLDKDPKFQARIADPAQREYIYGSTATTLEKKIAPESKHAVYIFLAALTFVVIISVASMMGINLLPSYPVEKVVDGMKQTVMKPLAYSLGIDGWILLGVMPSVYGYFFIPNYPSDIATVNFDRSGTTVIGKYLLNHSFMMPGMVHVVTSTIAGLGISYIYHFWLGMY